jgi:hypothetical protein
MIRILLFSLLLAGLPAAQAGSGKRLMRYNKPLGKVSLNLETGELERGPQVTSQASSTTTDLANLDLGGFIGVDSGGGFCEWIDSAMKGGGGMGTGPVPSDLVSNFTFAYCSTSLDTGRRASEHRASMSPWSVSVPGELPRPRSSLTSHRSSSVSVALHSPSSWLRAQFSAW